MATVTLSAPPLEGVRHTHEHGSVIQDNEDWDWWYEWCDHSDSTNLYLTLEMLNYVHLMDIRDLRCKAQKIIRANEPDRYCSRCPVCQLGTFDVWFAPSTLEVKHVECASALCTGKSYVDVPSGYVRSVAKFPKPISVEVDHAKSGVHAHTATTSDTDFTEPVIKRKRGRPPGSKNKKGTKKSRMLAARLLNQTL